MKLNPVYFQQRLYSESTANQSVAFSSFHTGNVSNVVLVFCLECMPWASAVPLLVLQMFFSPECCKQNFGNQYITSAVVSSGICRSPETKHEGFILLHSPHILTFHM